MSEELRTCRRTGCRWPAAASFSFRHATREVWLEPLLEESHPAVYDLCLHHAEALTVPRGWEVTDRRPAPTPPREPAGRDLAGAARAEDPPAGEIQDAGEPAAPPNRYAALSAALPRLAAEHAEHAEHAGGDASSGGARRSMARMN